VLSLMKVSTIALVDTLTLYRNALKCVRIGRLRLSGDLAWKAEPRADVTDAQDPAFARCFVAKAVACARTLVRL
jgi:hypothetical protein